MTSALELVGPTVREDRLVQSRPLLVERSPPTSANHAGPAQRQTRKRPERAGRTSGLEALMPQNFLACKRFVWRITRLQPKELDQIDRKLRASTLAAIGGIPVSTQARHSPVLGPVLEELSGAEVQPPLMPTATRQ
jgi:hypothetical protein